MLEESVVYQDVLQKGVRRGVQRGRREGKIENVLELIKLKFGRLSPKYKQQIESLSLQQIKMLLREVVSVHDKSEITGWLDAQSR